MSYLRVFDGFATPDPDEPWTYELDDYGVTYGPGPWPFYSMPAPGASGEAVEPTSVRLSPGYPIGNQHYMLAMPVGENGITLDFSLTEQQQGLGYWVARISVTLLPNGVIKSLYGIPKRYHARVLDRVRRFQEFFELAIAERATGATPINSHDRYEAKQKLKQGAACKTPQT